MILFIGDKALYDFVHEIVPDVTYDLPIEQADKLIVCDCSDSALQAVRAANLINIPILGILGGYQAVADALGARYEMAESCQEGKQELAVLDTGSALFKGLETVVRICRGTPAAVIDTALPPELDCIARAETGEVLAFSNRQVQNLGESIFAINIHLVSNLTPAGAKIIENFINIKVR